ncbi:hypothetical protein CGRA01v4_12592 [Colletotrichum graminicola]|nr:hypothetical protein CGRA01v4_12592 [Colletotrichum graminicola]
MATLQSIMKGASFRPARKWDEPGNMRGAGRQRANRPGCHVSKMQFHQAFPAVAAAAEQVGYNMCVRISRYRSCPNRGLIGSVAAASVSPAARDETCRTEPGFRGSSDVCEESIEFPFPPGLWLASCDQLHYYQKPDAVVRLVEPQQAFVTTPPPKRAG